MGRTAAGDRRGHRGRRTKLAVGGLLAAAAPLALAAPASAAFNTDEKTVSLTFVPNGGGVVTCRLEAYGAHETASPGFVFGQTESKRGDGQYVDICKGNHTTTLRYRDRGENKTFTSFSYNTDTSSSQVFDSDVSGILIQHSVFFIGCNPGASATCTLSTATAPK
jgi:hypothetical protein